MMTKANVEKKFFFETFQFFGRKGGVYEKKKYFLKILKKNFEILFQNRKCTLRPQKKNDVFFNVAQKTWLQ